MTEQEWLLCEDPETMLRHLSDGTSTQLDSERKLRLFACACCRKIWDRMTDFRSRKAVEVAYRFADGMASEQELVLAYGGAENAATLAHEEENTYGRVPIKAASAAAIAADDFYLRTSPFNGYAIANEVIRATIASCTTCANSAKYTPRATTDLQKNLSIILRDIVGSPFKLVPIQDQWKIHSVIQLAQAIYDGHCVECNGTGDIPRHPGGLSFSKPLADLEPCEKCDGRGVSYHCIEAMPILGDALEEAGCEREEILQHCRGGGIHVRGCWVVDLILALDEEGVLRE